MWKPSYANETLNVAPQRNGSRLGRYSSDRDPCGRRLPSIVRSNSSADTLPLHTQGRYLELLSSPYDVNKGYEIPRNVPYAHTQQPQQQQQPCFPKTNGLLRRFHSESPVNDNDNDDCLSDVTDESCLANSPTPLRSDKQVFRTSTSDVTMPSDSEC